MSYAKNREWSDRFIPAISSIVGPHLIVPAPFEIDVKQATDLIVLRARDMQIAARVRRHGYADRFPHDFTVRSKLPNGTKTEMAKIVDGWGDWMFYGHSDHAETNFDRWFLIDLHAFRAALIRQRKTVKWSEQKNTGDDDSYFLAFDLRSFRPSVLVASSHEICGEGLAA